MDWIIKKASSFSTEEQTALGITGIPQDWPVESYPYSGTVPSGYEQITEENLAILRGNNQAAYDAWVQSKRPLPAPATPLEICLDTAKDQYQKYYITNSMTDPDFYFSPHSLDFYTAKHKSLYNRLHDGAGIDDGTDKQDAVLMFYDASGAELVQGETESDVDFQTRLTGNCIKTIMRWEKDESYDVAGAQLYIEAKPQARAYLWVVAAPLIPYNQGGSKPFMGRGMNLAMMPASTYHYFDAKTSKTITYDPVYHSGMIDCVVKHAVGEQIGLQMIYILYEE